MKSNMIDKLYSKTPGRTLATLAANAVFRGEDAELTHIFAKIRNRRLAEQISATIKSNAVIMGFLTWRADLWHTYAQALEMRSAVLSDELDDEQLLIAEGAYHLFLVRLASLIAAMHQICENTGLEFEEMVTMFGFDEKKVPEEVKPNPEWVEEFVARFTL